MSHGDSVVHCDGVELDSIATTGVDDLLDSLANLVKVDVSRDELGEGIGDRDDGFLKILRLHSGGTPEGPGSSHTAPLSRDAAAESSVLHGYYLLVLIAVYSISCPEFPVPWVPKSDVQYDLLIPGGQCMLADHQNHQVATA